ncbi:uncharacterized protein LOC131994991 isoform X1 [Stomoxys calcitrans]|uniref:uncharacterized protein LOC131994991 isoform X1 n=1 Tax=Stomoxys calcitrans TaxID=35570 RepID=UPI0027E29E09|nr:uncharacterized protein LOC131994991 isoform X1 [Stomoxys calcitrans]
MSEDQDQPRRTSRRTQGIPPAYLKTYAIEMPIEHSPAKDTAGTSIHTEDRQDANTQNAPKKLSNPPAKTSPTKLSRELKKQVDQLQRQMQAMQTEYLTSTQQLQAQLTATVQQIQSFFTNNQSTATTTQQQRNPRSSPPSTQQPQMSTASEISYSQNYSIVPHKKIYPLPIFTGLPEEWQTFYEAFETTTTEFGYTNLHNIMRLRESIKGRARETVESLLSNSANVATILEILRETYGRPEQLVRSQIEKVRAIPPLANDNLDSLVNYATKISNMTTFLKNIKGEHHLSNPSLLSELVSKLPTNRQMQWAEKSLTLERPATIVDFCEWLSILRRLANIVNDTLPIASTSAGRRQTTSTNPQGRKYACVAVIQKCLICEGECHNIKECQSFLQMPVNDRWSKIQQTKTCFCCLKRGHRIKFCTQKRKCGINNCPKLHHRLLHNTQPHINTTTSLSTQQTSTSSMETRNESQNIPEAPQADARICHATNEANNILFQILPVKLYGTTKTLTTYAFVDDGANVSMLDENLSRELGLRGKPEILQLQWLNDHQISRKTEKINLTVSGVGHCEEKFTISNVYISPELSLPIQSCHISHFLKSRGLEKIPAKDYSHVQPKLILSLNHSFLTVPLQVPRMLADGGPFISMTRLGAIIYGPFPGEKISTTKRLHIQRRVDDHENQLLQEMHDMMRGYFDIETLGVKKVHERYECSLLWKEYVPPIPDSYATALKRLYSIERKMAKDREYATQYCDKINDYIKKGYARKLSQEEIENASERIFYLPHFGVKNPNKKGIRLVFDAAAETNQFSLNKALLQGPDINNSLISILFKFREAPVAVCGDIQEMFHQIAITKEDQHSQRFLWRDGMDNKPVETYVMQRLIFGATCSPTIAQYIKNVNAKNFIEEAPRAVHGIVERHYVDDYVDCFQSEEEAIQVLKDVIRIHKVGGFNLRNISSNSATIKNMYGNPVIESNHSDEFLSSNQTERVLGIHWLSQPDIFHFLLKLHKVDGEIVNCNKIPTKREMLSLNMSIYDPFGFIADFLITSKVLMQRVWKSGTKWDEVLPPDIYSHWKTWLEELQKILEFSVPRCYSGAFEKSLVDMHIFVDASEEAMAVVAYWRMVNSEFVEVAFIMGKTSCAPTRYHTIPKLELQAAVMGVRLKELIMQNHLKNINKCYFWTDSSTVLQWIRSDHRKYKQYVANRVAEVLENSCAKDWRWCPGVENPADDATRAKYSKNYNADGRWKNGPKFLLLDESKWPKVAEMGEKIDRSATELRAKYRILVTHQVCAVVPNFNRFSKYRRLKRAMAWIHRYIKNLRRCVRGETCMVGELDVEEEVKAELYLCRYVQQQYLADELEDLRKNGHVSQNSSIKMLNPYVDDENILRVSGRLENAKFLSLEARRPIILPKGSPFTRLVVQSYHQKFLHINMATALSEIRLRFWVPSLRQLLKSVQSACQACKIRAAKPNQPQMAPLPVERVTPYVRAFTYTGLDYFGPVSVAIGRRREKRWVALFTCLTIRAVHLEIAADLSSDACLLCIRNFVNRRGVPVLIRSDNGTNFVGIPKELQGVSNFVNNDSLASGVTALGIKWLFNTPSNPSEGGVWERLVQSVKKALYIMLKEQAPRLATLQAFLIETENMVNSRPLTHLPISPDDPEPLTPNHFLLGCTNSTQTPAPFEPRLLCLRKQWRVLQCLKNGMWRQWIREYLPELTRRTKWCLPSQPLEVGCLVFICDVEAPRSHWKRGRVIELHKGKDGVARSADVRTSTGILRRPLSKLAVLDVKLGVGIGSESSPGGSVHGGGDVGDGNPSFGNANQMSSNPRISQAERRTTT